MTLSPVNALIVESDIDRATRICSQVEKTTDLVIRCKQVSCLSEEKNQLIEARWDFAIVRLDLPDANGLDALVEAHARQSDLPVIAILEGDEPTAVVDAARSLVDECILWKDLDQDSLSQSIRHALERVEMLKELRVQQTIRAAIDEESKYKDLIDRIDEAVLVVSEQSGSLMFSNETAESWFGETIEEVVAGLLEYDLRKVDCVEMEISIRHPNTPNVALKSNRLEWAGQSACMIALKDISKQKEAEEAYRNSRRQLAAIGDLVESVDEPEEVASKPELVAEIDLLDLKKDVDCPGKALIVDDEDVLQMVLKSILSSLGYETIVASDGLEAVRLYEDNRDAISLAIVDLNMPGLNGGEVFQRIREDGRRIPILVTSGMDDFDTLPFDDFKKENSRFLMKPFGATDVRQAIELLIGNEVVDAAS